MIFLKIKTEFSLGQTFAPIPRIIEYLRRAGATHAAICDNSTFGHVPWHSACTQAGIHPLFGWECLICNGENAPSTCWFLAKNTQGLTELYHLATKAHHQKLKTQPRLYPADLLTISENVLKFQGTFNDGELLAKIGAYVDFLPTTEIELNASKQHFARRYNLKCVRVHNNLYTTQADLDAFKCLAPDVPLQITRGLDVPLNATQNELNNMQAIAIACENVQLPSATLPKIHGDLDALARQGIARRNLAWNAEYESRLQTELSLIKSKSFESYFLIVTDLVTFAKENGILVGPARGSAAGSLVCYLLGITEINPLPLALSFERFLDENRTELPDIDLDFPDNARTTIFNYARKKYGTDKVAKIATIARLKPKSALNLLSKNTPALPKYAIQALTIGDNLQQTFATPAGQTFCQKYPSATLALQIENHATHASTHAAGLLITDSPIANYATIDNSTACLDKVSAESLGLLKIDILGLRTLTILSEIKGIPWYSIVPNDCAVFDLLNENRLCGIFQLEAPVIRKIKRTFAVHTWHDLAALIAIARPGPIAAGIATDFCSRKLGKPAQSIHPALDALLADTFGLPIYQEQTIAICVQIAGFSAGRANRIRKLISKRNDSGLDAEFNDFLAGATANGFSNEQARATWHLISTMAQWQMNKSHAYAYALVAFWTAYAKCYQPAQFAAAALNHAKTPESALALLREMKMNEGLEYVPFDYAQSELGWAVKNGVLHGGFQQLQGITITKARALCAGRDNGEPEPNGLVSTYANLTPLQAQFSAMYANPQACNIAAAKVFFINELLETEKLHGAEYVFLGILKSIKVAENAVDFWLADDTASVKCRAKNATADVLKPAKIGDILLIRAKFYYNYPMAHAIKIKTLSSLPSSK